MPPRILLVDDTATAAVPIPVPGKVLCVHHKDFAPPTGDWDVLAFEAFREDARARLAGYAAIIFVGLSRSMTPGTRTEMVWEVLGNKTPGLYKVSVDTVLFVSEPWRAWFPFGIVGAPYREYTYSYIAESHHKAFIDGLREDDPFAIEEIVRWGRGVIRSDHDRHFDEPEVSIVPASEADHAAYLRLKTAAFAEEASIAAIIDRLAAFAAEVCPRRAIPTPPRLFRRRDHRIVATDLPVDRWLVARTLGLMALTDGIAGAFSDGNGRVQERGRARRGATPDLPGLR